MHFTGVGGNGMSALAQFHVLGGGEATGSDRFFDRGEAEGLRSKLAALGVRLYTQDGTGVDLGTREVVASAAVEEGNADLRRARELGLPVVARGDALARLASGRRTISIAGTSGKSTVTAMVFEVLAAAGRDPSMLTGGPVNSVKTKGLLGNAFKGRSDLLVIEADESDGTLTKAPAWIGAMLSLSKDHKELAELRELFRRFKSRSERFVVNAEGPNLDEFRAGARTFGFEVGDLRGRDLKVDGRGSSFSVDGARFELPVPGRYNAENALAAAAVCLEAGVALEVSARALRSFSGVERRFESLGSARGVEVVDDFAHNPEKVRAALAAARLRSKRVLAAFQLHGFAPARLMKAEFIEAFGAALRPSDALWLLPIFYAGGTTTRDIGPEDFARPLAALGRTARTPPGRRAALDEIVAFAKEGDLVLVMGARDPTLSDFARAILDALAGRQPSD